MFNIRDYGFSILKLMTTVSRYFWIYESSFYVYQFYENPVFRERLAETKGCFLKSGFFNRYKRLVK